MEYRIFENDRMAAEKIVLEMTAIMHKKEHPLFCLAAGHTSLPVFALMIAYQNKGIADFTECYYVGLDEWSGMDAQDQGSCRYFMDENLFRPLGINQNHIWFYDGKANLKEECVRIDQVINHLSRIDYMLLGVGLNGHLGLNEPNVDFMKRSLYVELDSVTKEVGQKYFEKATSHNGGITLGWETISEYTDEVVLLVTGAHKQEILEKILTEPVDKNLPASYIRTLKSAKLYADKAAVDGKL